MFEEMYILHFMNLCYKFWVFLVLSNACHTNNNKNLEWDEHIFQFGYTHNYQGVHFAVIQLPIVNQNSVGQVKIVLGKSR